MNNIYNCTSKAGSVLPNQLQALWRYVLVLAAILFLSTNAATAQIVIDGNTNDWAGIYSNQTVVVKTLVRDANNTNDDQFTGGSQDPDLISEWSWVNGNTNDKGDISNAGAALIGCNLYFFGDRTAINGDAQIGFWFFKGQVSPSGSGTTNSSFTGQHQLGDLLILSNFTNGGGISSIRVYEWVGSGGSDGSLNLLTQATSSGAVNSVPVAVPNVTYEGDTWSYTPKVGPSGTYPTGAFFEGTVNLCTLYGAQSAPCFSSFLLETRNSQSTTASLQDFAAGGFDVTPIKYALTGSSFCSSNATTGTITLADSQPGVTYQLLSSTDQGVQAAQTGTGGPLTWTNVAPGTGYRVVATRAGFNCPVFTDRVDVISYPAATVEAGGPNTVCQSANPSAITLAGATIGGGATTGAWSIVSGGGSLSTTAQVANPATVTYTPAPNYFGSVTLQLTTNDPAGPCPAVNDTRTITINRAVVVEAGGPLVVCQSTTSQNVALTGASVTGGTTTGTWSIVSSVPAGANSLGNNSVASGSLTVAANYTGTITVRLTSADPDGEGPCQAVSDDRTVTVNPRVIVEAGGPDNRCQSTSAQVIALTGASVTGGATTGTWSIFSSNPAGANSLTNNTLANGSLTVAANYIGTITLRLTSPDPDGPCPAVTDDRIINISPAATVDAGGPLTACQSATAQVVALTGASATGGAGVWTIVSSVPAGANTIGNNTAANGTLNVAANYTGTITLKLTVADPDGPGPCQAVEDERTVTIYPRVIVDAGGPDNRCQSPTAQVIALTGASVTGGATTGTWSIVSSNPVNAGNMLTNTTLGAGSLIVAANYTGTITLQLASADPAGPCPAITDTRIINISPAATVDAGEPISVCQSQMAQAIALTGASATGGTATWSIFSANPVNAGITLINNTVGAGSLNVPANYTGSIVVRLAVADPDGPNGPCVAVHEDRTITIYPGVTVEAGGPNDVCQSANPVAITLIGATIGGGATTGAWSIVSGGGSLSTTAQVANPATVTYTPAPNFTGTVTLRLTTNDPAGPCGANNDTRIINVYPAATLNAGGPYVVPCAVNGGVRQVTLAPVFGGGATSVTWTVPTGMGTVVNNVYTPSATALAAGTPVILTVMTNDPTGPCPAASAQVTVTFAVCQPFEGCTLGYWKNHTNRWCSSITIPTTSTPPSTTQLNISTSTKYGTVFVNAPDALKDLTLLQVLNLGGGGIYNLARQSVAALLNICHTGVNYNSAYPTTVSLINAVNAAFQAGGTAPGTLATRLDNFNNAGCPLGGTPATTAKSERSPDGVELMMNGSGTELSAYPNPYTTSATIEFSLKEDSDYTLVLHDVKGSVVKRISTGKAVAGRKYSFEIGNKNMPEGIYIARLSTDKINKVIRISLRR